MKKTKLVTKSLAVLLAVGLMLAGCSDQSAQESSSDQVEASVNREQSSESTESVDSGEASSQEKTSEESKESSVEITSGEVTTDNKIGGGTSTEIATGNPELEAQYKEYFKSFSMEGKKMILDCQAEENGMKMDFNMTVGTAGEQMVMAVTANGNEMSLYRMDDGSAYVHLHMGEESGWYKTSSMDKEEMDDLNIAEDLFESDDEEEMNLKYVGTETIDGLVYDVLTMDEDTDEETPEVLFYMNQENKEFELFKGTSDGVNMVGRIEKMESFVLPEGWESAEELEAEEFGMTVLFSMLGVMTGGEGLNFSE